jgi:hypothetical protein
MDSQELFAWVEDQTSILISASQVAKITELVCLWFRDVKAFCKWFILECIKYGNAIHNL